MTIYVPDELADEVKKTLGDANLSQICQAALKAELKAEANRAKARAKDFGDELELVVLYDSERGHKVKFEGRVIGYVDAGDQTAYLTLKECIAVYSGTSQRLGIYGDWDDFVEHELDPDLTTQVADALGEEYIEDLYL